MVKVTRAWSTGTTSDGSRSSDELLGSSSCPMLMWMGIELSEGMKYCGVCVCVWGGSVCVCVCGVWACFCHCYEDVILLTLVTWPLTLKYLNFDPFFQTQVLGWAMEMQWSHLSTPMEGSMMIMAAPGEQGGRFTVEGEMQEKMVGRGGR